MFLSQGQIPKQRVMGDMREYVELVLEHSIMFTTQGRSHNHKDHTKGEFLKLSKSSLKHTIHTMNDRISVAIIRTT